MPYEIPSPKALLDKMIERGDVVNAEMEYGRNLHIATCECDCQAFYALVSDTNIVFCAECGSRYDLRTTIPFWEPMERDVYLSIDDNH